MDYRQEISNFLNKILLNPHGHFNDDRDLNWSLLVELATQRFDLFEKGVALQYIVKYYRMRKRIVPSRRVLIAKSAVKLKEELEYLRFYARKIYSIPENFSNHHSEYYPTTDRVRTIADSTGDTAGFFTVVNLFHEVYDDFFIEMLTKIPRSIQLTSEEN